MTKMVAIAVGRGFLFIESAAEMKIFHINSYFQTNELHLQLVNALEKQSFVQSVFIPLPVEAPVANEVRVESKAIRLDYVRCFKSWHRYIWPYKMLRIWWALKDLIERSGADLVHAHTLISNGLFAYLIKRSFGIPFVVTVRGTDTEFFFEKSLIFVRLGLKILRAADAIVLLSPGYLDRRLPHFFPKDEFSDIYGKCFVIPNGVSEEWRRERFSKKKYKGGVFVFVGRVDKNKNLNLVIDALSERARRGFFTRLHVVGDGPELPRLKLRAEGLDCVFHGRLNEISKIKEVMAGSDVLILPSFKETFGLVYVEAMSQGLPIVYTRGQGFDGFFAEGEVGYSVDPGSVEDLLSKLGLIAENYDGISKRAVAAADSFDWLVIAKRIASLYRQTDNVRLS